MAHPVRIGSGVAEVMAELSPGLRARLDDDAFWAAKDAEVGEAIADEERRTRAEEWAARRTVLEVGHVPRRALDVVFSPAMEASSEPMTVLAGWEGRNVIALVGGVGVGKTVAATWWLAHRGGTAPAFVRAAELEALGRYDRLLRERWSSASALVVDDLGCEYADAKGNLLAIFDELIDFYYAETRALILLSNMTGADFKARYGERITSRLRHENGWRPVEGHDRRRPQLRTVKP